MPPHPITPPEAPAEAAPATAAPATSRTAYFALAVLFSMNMLNYVDRYVFYSVGELISKEMGFTDFRFGILSAAFMVVYTLVSPVMGVLGDRYSRRRLLAFGVGLWSLATVGTAFAGQAFGANFWEMFFWRALLGLGEASYGVIAPALLSDLFPPKHRGRVIGLFFLALPVGGAIGYGLGGWIGSYLGWRAAFLVVGLPGLLAAFAALMIHDPGRGASEGAIARGQAARPALRDYLSFFRNRTFLLNTAGLTAVTFATGALAVWGASFYQRVHGLEAKTAGFRIGGLTLAAGLIGIALGIWLPDRLRRVTPRAYLLWAGCAVLGAVPLGAIGLLDTDTKSSLTLLFFGSILLSSVLGPCNTVTADVVPANRRAAGFALSIFLLHLLGDIASPPLIGWLSDVFGRPVLADSAVGQVFAALGHTPKMNEEGHPTNLTVGMLSVIPMLTLGGLFFLLGSRSLADDIDRARAESAGADNDGAILH